MIVNFFVVEVSTGFVWCTVPESGSIRKYSSKLEGVPLTNEYLIGELTVSISTACIFSGEI